MTEIERKLLLTYPNQRWQKVDVNTTWNLNPYTLCILAAMVKNDVKVKIIDAHFYNMSLEEFEKQVEEYGPDYVGISVMTTEYADILDITANAVKKINPDIIALGKNQFFKEIELEAQLRAHGINAKVVRIQSFEQCKLCSSAAIIRRILERNGLLI